jgi:hypothetical protein
MVDENKSKRKDPRQLGTRAPLLEPNHAGGRAALPCLRATPPTQSSSSAIGATQKAALQPLERGHGHKCPIDVLIPDTEIPPRSIDARLRIRLWPSSCQGKSGV